MSRDVKRTISLYTRLFSLPRARTMLTIMAMASVVIGALSEFLRSGGIGGLTAVGIGALRGLLVVLPPAGLAMLLLWLGAPHQGILRRHRLIGIMMSASILLLIPWLLSTLLGWILACIWGPMGIWALQLFPKRGFLLGTGFALAIIYLTIMSITPSSPPRGVLLSLIFPTTSIAVFALTEATIVTSASLTLYLISYLAIAAVFIGCVHILLWIVGRPLRRALNIDGMQLFRGFLAVWMEGQADLIETCFRRMGQRRPLPLAVVSFTVDGQPSLIFVAAAVHPGPFKDTGSSALPSAVAAWGREMGATACALHGTATHDLNLVSRSEVTRFIEDLRKAYSQVKPVEGVSPFARAKAGTIQAGCQLFGDTALIVITRSPHEMDDISLSVGRRIAQEVEKLVPHCIVVDAHNCIGELRESVCSDSKLVPEMVKASVEATRLALSRPRSRPRVGVATRRMSQFTAAQGMGPEGITAAVIEAAGQRMAYILIDGNNMAIGLRESLLQELVPHLVDEAEILTTDTHQVAAITTRGEGYSPIGLDIPHPPIIQAVKELVTQSLKDLKPAQASVTLSETSPLHVMGEGTVDTLTALIPPTARLAKRTATAALGGALLISLLLLSFA